MPHSNDDTVKPSTEKNITLRQPSRLASQPVIGVATAVATRFSVMTQAISSWVADRAPRICGSTTLASVIVMPNSSVDNCTVSRTIHCRRADAEQPGQRRRGARGDGRRLRSRPLRCRATRLVSANDKTGYRLERGPPFPIDPIDRGSRRAPRSAPILSNRQAYRARPKRDHRDAAHGAYPPGRALCIVHRRLGVSGAFEERAWRTALISS